MKKILLMLCIIMYATDVKSQTVEYQTFIYTSDTLADEIQAYQEAHADELAGDEDRSFLGDLFNAGLDAAKGIASNQVSTVIDMGVNAIASLITRNSRLKCEWEQTVAKENIWQSDLNDMRTIAEMNDFYKRPSFNGAMDPKGMRFDGIGCLRKEGNDTLFYVSCHVDRSKLFRIVNHSKFELVLDTLIVSPLHSNLPNTRSNGIKYSFDERENFNLSMTMKLFSSWMNEITQLQKDQELGNFMINIPVDPSMLDNSGYLRYVRQNDEQPRFPVNGECFIVPRSFMGYRDSDGQYRNCWGTGEYKMSVSIQETCDITDKYRKNWKSDRKRRKDMMLNQSFWTKTWTVISSQKWDEITQSWVITTLKAPAEIVKKETNSTLHLEQKSGKQPK